MSICVNDYVGFTKKDFTVFYSFNLLTDDEKKDDMFLLYSILDRVETLEEFYDDPDKANLKGQELGSIS